MQALILAAGMGRRLGKLTRNSTKCMLEINGRRLIEYSLDAIVEAGINSIVLVVGHGAEELYAFLGDSYRGADIRYVHNPIYARSNNIYSLLLARDYLQQDDILLLESDIIFDKSIITDCINEPSPDVVVVAKYQPWMDGAIAILNEGNCISSFVFKEAFDYMDSGKYFKTVSIHKFSKEFCRDKLIPFLVAYTTAKGIDGYYEEVLKVLAFIDSSQLKALEVGEKIWYEIDDIQDLDIASVLFASDAE